MIQQKASILKYLKTSEKNSSISLKSKIKKSDNSDVKNTKSSAKNPKKAKKDQNIFIKLTICIEKIS